MSHRFEIVLVWRSQHPVAARVLNAGCSGRQSHNGTSFAVIYNSVFFFFVGYGDKQKNISVAFSTKNLLSGYNRRLDDSTVNIFSEVEDTTPLFTPVSSTFVALQNQVMSCFKELQMGRLSTASTNVIMLIGDKNVCWYLQSHECHILHPCDSLRVLKVNAHKLDWRGKKSLVKNN